MLLHALVRLMSGGWIPILKAQEIENNQLHKFGADIEGRASGTHAAH